MSFMILAGGLDRSTTVLTMNYNQFQDLDSRIGKGGSKWERGKEKHKVRHEIKKSNDKKKKKKKKIKQN